MVSRRLLLLALLGLVLVVGVALGRTTGAVAAGDRVPTGVAPAAHAAHDHPHARDSADDDAAPCVLRSDCAGAWVFGSAGVLLAVVVAGPTVGAVTTVSRLRAFSQVMSSRLDAGRLFRPPRFS